MSAPAPGDRPGAGAPRVLFFGTFESDYPRNRILRAGLAARGVAVTACHEAVWERTADKTAGYRGRLAKGRLGARLLAAHARLGWRYLRGLPPHDVILVGYLGHFDVPLARLAGWLAGRPVVFDAFVSLVDTSVGDRRLTPPRSPLALALEAADRLSCRLADRVVVDTEEHAAFFRDRLGVDPAKLVVVPVGADEAVVRPPTEAVARDDDAFTVLLYGKFTPLHGVEHVIEAARLLEARGAALELVLLGAGQERERAVRRVRELDLRSVRLRDPVPHAELVRVIAASDLVLGLFGASAKAGRVVPNKVYEGLAMGKPVLTADTPAVRRLLRPGEEVAVVPPADPGALADAVASLAADPAARARLGAAGRRAYCERFRPATVVGPLVDALAALSGRRPEEAS